MSDPHAAYLAAVADAFTRDNMEPTVWEALEDEHPEGYIKFGSEHPAIDTYSSWPQGVQLTWDLGGWQVVDVEDRSTMDVWAETWVAPNALVALVKPCLVDGKPLRKAMDAPCWEPSATDAA